LQERQKEDRLSWAKLFRWFFPEAKARHLRSNFTPGLSTFGRWFAVSNYFSQSYQSLDLVYSKSAADVIAANIESDVVRCTIPGSKELWFKKVK
jgi:hypothetical protein